MTRVGGELLTSRRVKRLLCAAIPRVARTSSHLVLHDVGMSDEARLPIESVLPGQHVLAQWDDED